LITLLFLEETEMEMMVETEVVIEEATEAEVEEEIEVEDTEVEEEETEVEADTEVDSVEATEVLANHKSSMLTMLISLMKISSPSRLEVSTIKLATKRLKTSSTDTTTLITLLFLEKEEMEETMVSDLSS